MLESSAPLARELELKLPELLSDLLTDGLITRQQREQLLFVIQQNPANDTHPIAVVAEQGWGNLKDPQTQLDAEGLICWLAERCNLPYVRIDPLKVDVSAVTNVVSYAYATRFKILPIAVQGDRVTIATSEPYIREWGERAGWLAAFGFRTGDG